MLCDGVAGDLQFQNTGIAQTVLRINNLGLNAVTAAGVVG
jgi:hypothetical protein